MQRLCRKCGVIKPDATGEASESCPACGAVYLKVESMYARSQERDSSVEIANVPPQKSASLRRQLLLPFLLVAIVLGLFIQHVNEDRTPSGTEEGERITAIKYAIDMSPDDLANGFAENEVRQSAIIQGRYVRVRGVVASVAKGVLGGMIVELGQNLPGATLRARLRDDQRARVASLSKGDGVTIICSSFTYSFGSPSGSDCIIE